MPRIVLHITPAMSAYLTAFDALLQSEGQPFVHELYAAVRDELLDPHDIRRNRPTDIQWHGSAD